MLRFGIVIAIALAFGLGTTLLHAAPDEEFSISDLPPPEPVTTHAPTLYEALAIGNTSPRGTSIDALKPTELVDEASAFLRGANGHPKDEAEAAYWLKRAIAVAPDDLGQRRAWAATRLGTMFWQSKDDPANQHLLAQALWELGGAWNNGEALCNLGEITEKGDQVSGIRADRQQALVWYQRAAGAGCAKAAEAIARLKQ